MTAGSTAATSTNIADYNTFVTQQVDLNPTLRSLGATWNADCNYPVDKRQRQCPESTVFSIYGTNGQLFFRGVWRYSVCRIIGNSI